MLAGSNSFLGWCRMPVQNAPADWALVISFLSIPVTPSAPAGELNLIILEMLPRLAPGVYVHFHDICFPYDYSPDTLSTALFFSHETALLYAFLLMNRDFEIAGSLSMLHHQRLDDLRQFFPDIRPAVFEDGLIVKSGQFPSSIFLRRLAE